MVWNLLITRSVMATKVAITLRVMSGTFQNARMIPGMRIIPAEMNSFSWVLRCLFVI